MPNYDESAMTLPQEAGSSYNELKNDVQISAKSSITIPAPDESTLILFDWDDTLLCSSFLSSRGYRLDSEDVMPDELEAQLDELSDSIIAALELALAQKHAETCIVTNAETGWVELSCQKFLPRVVPWLDKISICSARSTYEADFPESPTKWKLQAFREHVKVFGGAHDSCRNVISLGDSQAEREAVHAVTRDLCNVRTKSIKFVERPSIEQLKRQLDLVLTCFPFIVEHDDDLDLMLTVNFNCDEGDSP